jgi:hypothetical protein
MVKGACRRAKIESGACKNAVEEIALEPWILCIKWAEVVHIVLVEVRRPHGKASWIAYVNINKTIKNKERTRCKPRNADYVRITEKRCIN